MTEINLLSLRVVKEKSENYYVNEKIVCPEDIRNIGTQVLELHTYAEEAFAIMTLDTKHKINGVFIVSHGSLNASIVHPREVFKRALMQNASAIALMHNHPSGDTKPSGEDINITKRLKEAGTLLGVNVLDHVILGDDEYSYFSMKEQDLI